MEKERKSEKEGNIKRKHIDTLAKTAPTKKQFKGKKNEDLWQRFLKVYRRHKVHFQWIKGHNQHPQNEWCDQLAVKAAKSKEKLKDSYYERLHRERE